MPLVLASPISQVIFSLTSDIVQASYGQQLHGSMPWRVNTHDNPVEHGYPSPTQHAVHVAHLSTACLQVGFRAQAKPAALQSPAAEAGTGTASLGMLMRQEDQAVLTPKQQRPEEQQRR